MNFRTSRARRRRASIVLTLWVAAAQAANDYIVAPSGGDITGATLSARLAEGDVSLKSSDGNMAGAGNVIINDVVNWSANTTLTLTASNSVEINAEILASGDAAGLTISPDSTNGGEPSSGNGAYLFNAPAVTLSGKSPALTIAGMRYTVINRLGSSADATTAPAIPTLQGMSAAANLSGNFALGSDIDAGATSGWNGGKGFIPIGTSDNPFVGSLDGLGHVIRNFTINLPINTAQPATNINVGLFGVLGNGYRNKGVVRNVGVSDGSVSGWRLVGGLAGQSNGTISNSYTALTVTSGGYGLGGLVGQNQGTISNSYATGSVASSGFSVGGLVGESYGSVSNCYATGNVSGANNTGGLVGAGKSYSAIANSYATGNVQGANSVGGLVGEMRRLSESGASTVEQSFATGNVTGQTNVGGLVGISYSDDGQGGNSIGGSYSTGRVSGGGTHIGGLVGYNESGNAVGDSYWDAVTSGQSRSSGGTGLTAEQMKTVSRLVGFPFTTTPGRTGWVIVDEDSSLNNAGGASGATYPMLASHYSTVIRNVRQFRLMVLAPSARYVFDADPSAKMQTVNSYAGLNITFTTTPGADGWVIVDEDGSLNNADGATGATYPINASEYSTSIISAHQLQLMAMAPAADYTLAADVEAMATGAIGDVWGSSGFVPLVDFNGTFDGQGRTIRNLSIDLPNNDNIGLFGQTNPGSMIKNVGLVGGGVSGKDNVGALVGRLSGSTVSNSFATTAVTGNGMNIGGLVGNIRSGDSGSAIVGNSYATGSVVGSSNVGGLAGQLQAGGGKATIASSYAAGRVSGSADNVGGLVGLNSGGMVSAGYWNTTRSGQELSAGGSGLSEGQMRSAGSFLGFDFGTPVWVIVDADGSLNNADGVDGATSPLLALEHSTSIGSAHQLQLMALNPDADYTLATDIDAEGTGGVGDVWGSAGFAPVGGYSVPFSGSFDGQGHSIAGLSVNQRKLNRSGLFGVVGSDATLRNAVLTGGSVTGYGGSVGALAGINNGTVTDCRTSVTVKSPRGGFVGGMVGSNNGTLSGSQAGGAVSGTGGFRGGVAGVNRGTLNNCSSTATMTGDGGFSGPLVGYNDGTIN